MSALKHTFADPSKFRRVGGFVVVTTWREGKFLETRSKPMSFEAAEAEAKDYRRICTVVSAVVEPAKKR